MASPSSLSESKLSASRECPQILPSSFVFTPFSQAANNSYPSPPPSKLCAKCLLSRPSLVRPSTKERLCKECFFECFEYDVHTAIVTNNLFEKNDNIVIGVSGGKDSSVLAYVLHKLNEKYSYNANIKLLAIDEGIKGYREDALETVKENAKKLNLPLLILSYEELHGYTMDRIVSEIGLKNNCTYCGVFRRQALDKGAKQMRGDILCTGHNADDAAETVLMNIMRGDIGRLGRAGDILTGKRRIKRQTSKEIKHNKLKFDGENRGENANDEILTNDAGEKPEEEEEGGRIPRCKPMMYIYEKEIVMYAHFKNIKYFATECTYSPNAYRGYLRELIKKMENLNPQIILDIIHSSQHMCVNNNNNKSDRAEEKGENDNSTQEKRINCVTVDKEETQTGEKIINEPKRRIEGAHVHSANLKKCIKCGEISSNEICQACNLLIALQEKKTDTALYKKKKNVNKKKTINIEYQHHSAA